MNKVHISGYGSILYFIYRSTFITLLLPFLVSFNTDSIWIVILGSIFGYFLLSFYLKIAQKNKYDNIIVGIDKKVFKGIGFILNTLLAIGILYFFILLFTKLTIFTGTEYLKGTPTILISLLFLFIIIYIGRKDIETVSRASLIFFMVSFILLIVKFSGLWNQLDFSNLLPIFTHKPTSLLVGSLKYASIGILPLFLILLINPKDITPTKRIKQKTKWFYILTSSILFINVLLILTVLGPELLSLYNYPEVHLLRNIKLLGFMDRLEPLLSIQWIIDMVICLSICFIYIKTYFLYYGKKTLRFITSKV